MYHLSLHVYIGLLAAVLAVCIGLGEIARRVLPPLWTSLVVRTVNGLILLVIVAAFVPFVGFIAHRILDLLRGPGVVDNESMADTILTTAAVMLLPLVLLLLTGLVKPKMYTPELSSKDD